MLKISIRKSTLWLVLLQLVITIAVLYWIIAMYDASPQVDWAKTIGWMALIMMAQQLFFLYIQGKRAQSFEVWFILFSYLFMFGRIFLVGVLGIEEITALNYDRTVFDDRYSVTLHYQSALFVLMAIQLVFYGFLLNGQKTNVAKAESDPALYQAGVIMLCIGIPCHLIYSLQMITNAQVGGSYNSIVHQTGLIDDLSNFLIYGLICLIFSGRYSKTTLRNIIIATTAYLIIAMTLTGDRRYQTVSIIVLLLAYAHSTKVKFSFKIIWIGIGAIFLLALFYVLREIRTSELTSLGNFVGVFWDKLAIAEDGLLTQTLYEFGGSLYTVCLAIKYVPSHIGFKYGSTIISGILSIIPAGFIYQDWEIFQYGRLAHQLLNLAETTVGASVFADLYGNFGWIGGGIAAFMLGLLLPKLLEKKNNRLSCALVDARYYILFYALIHLARASFTEVIRTAAWALMILYFAYHLRTKRNYANQSVQK